MNGKTAPGRIVVGITDCSKFTNYERWFNPGHGVEVIRLGYEAGNLNDIERCDGVVLSGGEDVHPRFYNKPEYLEYCHDIDERRDDFEWRVLEYAVQHAMPLLGICRGLQMANVFFGGTLIPDIPSFGRFNHSRFSDADRYHTVQVDPLSELRKIAGLETGQINSAHHQSAGLVGKDLVANSISPDGIIEGLERRDKDGKPYLMLVQWHPERMTDPGSPFSLNIRESFLESVRTNKKQE